MRISSNVVAIAPKPQAFEDAVIAFSLGRNVDCLSALHHHQTFEAVAFRTRALFRLRRLREAEGCIRLAHPRAGRQDDIAHCYMLLGTTLARRGDHDGAADAFLQARAFGLSVPSVALHAEIALYHAHSAWMRRDIEAINKIIDEAFAERKTPYDQAHAFPLAVSRAFMHELRGVVAGHDGRFQDQIGYLNAGLSELKNLESRDVWSESSLLDNLSPLVADLDVPHVANRVRKHAESLPWSEETRIRAYNVYRSLGWSSALRGDLLAAMRDLREAHAFAPNAAWEIEALLDRSYLLREVGEWTAAQDRLDEAYRLAQSMDWTDADGEERLALLWLAENMAGHKLVNATTVVERYRAIRKPLDRRFAYATDKRFRGLELDALGAVEAMTGQRSRAIGMLHEARDLWIGLGFEWRAAKSARAIARISNSENDLAEAHKRAEPWPASWLARAV